MKILHSFSNKVIYVLLVQHPQYVDNRERGHPGDICVVRLRTPANITSPYITPIRMPPKDADNPPEFIGRNCAIAGWGNTGSRSRVGLGFKTANRQAQFVNQ